MRYDFILIGGGIVGAATAWQLLQRFPGRRLLLLEKEPECARHQTGRNSGVIHAGVYYTPGSLKARLCREGAAATVAFCREYGLPWERCGKLLVATNALELERMRALAERCRQNGIDFTALDAGALREREPVVTGLGALYVPATGMTDYAAICRQLLALVAAAGGEIRYGSEAKAVVEHADGIVVTTERDEYRGDYLVACAGLMADRLARLQGLAVEFRIVPFRGEYFRLREDNAPALHHHIYPIPDPALPFLGIHLTRMIDGGVTIGPNAVLAAGREAYLRGRPDWRELGERAVFPGFWRLLARYRRAGLEEFLNSRSPARYLRQAQKYCPQLCLADLQPHPAGIRAQAVSSRGELLQDFLLIDSRRSLHVCNAPSPAATSALPIGAFIVEQVGRRLGEMGAAGTKTA